MNNFDDRLEEAIKILWFSQDYKRGGEAAKIFDDLIKEDNADAYFFMARCYAGSCFVNPAFGFPENDDKCDEYLNLSIEKGSAIGMFGARRFGGFKPRCGSFVHAPYTSSAEIWNTVCMLANSGELFSKYLVANAYYYGDVAEFFNMSFSSRAELDRQFRTWAETAIPIYDELIANKMFLCVGNYINIITSGDYGLPKNPQKAQQLKELAAENNVPFYLVQVGLEYKKTNPQKAADYFQRAIDNGYTDAYFHLGDLYTFNSVLNQNLAFARDCFEKCLALDPKNDACHNGLAEIYFYGGEGIAPDYNKAFNHLIAAYREENYWGSHLLGTCYLKGHGTPIDYARAKAEFERDPNTALSAIGLGEIYAYGLGVEQDIKKGMSYWNKYSRHSRVIENKKNFARTLFGWKCIV